MQSPVSFSLGDIQIAKRGYGGSRRSAPKVTDFIDYLLRPGGVRNKVGFSRELKERKKSATLDAARVTDRGITMGTPRVFLIALLAIAFLTSPFSAADDTTADGFALVTQEIDETVERCNGDPECFRHFYSPIKELLFELRKDDRITNREFRKVRKRLRKILSATSNNVTRRSSTETEESTEQDDDPETYDEFVAEIELSREFCDREKRCYRKEHRRIRKLINGYMVQKTLGRNAIRQLYRLMKQRLR